VIDISVLPGRVLSLWNPNQTLASAVLPAAINPFADDVDVVAVIPPQGNIKFLTVLGLFLGAKTAGALDDIIELVESTSGNTGLWILLLAQLFGIGRVTLLISGDLPAAKRDALLIAGANFVVPFSGKTLIETARILGTERRALCFDQYANVDGAVFHREWLAPKILALLGCVDFFATAIGTGGHILGVGAFLKNHCEGVTVVGGLCAPKQEVPGARDRERVKASTLPWTQVTDYEVEVETRSAYVAAASMHRFAAVPAGGTGGMALCALLRILHQKKVSGELDVLRERVHGRKLRAAFIVPDFSAPYTERFTASIPTEWFGKLPPLSEILW
jgi:cysteine synthase